MTNGQRLEIMARLLNTSVSDCAQDLQRYSDTTLLCDLLIECHKRGQVSREKAVRARIAKLAKGGRYT